MERIADLQCKEVVNITDGSRLGYVGDVEIDVLTGRVVAIVVPGRCRFFGLFGRSDDYVIPWQCIRRFGEDIILVEVVPDRVCTPRPKRKWF
ncbi:MAG: YlmC/YmxH family sporulation protein [Clostridiales bacterium]|nr:YlmC/YmxH family sporulation protein [Clostridiales bacterium]